MLRLLAIGDLLRRYATVFGAAWAQRKACEGPRYGREEAQFLPAALALQATPVSPAPRLAMWIIILFAAVAVAWAWYGHIDIVATAQGKVVPSDRIKVVQPAETAVVKAIHVADGQIVKAGDVLLELDATTAAADTARLAGELAMARLQVNRARALIAALDGGRPPGVARPDGAQTAAWQDAQRLAEGQYQELRAKLAQLDADAATKDAERRSVLTMIQRREQTLPIARQRSEDFRQLAEQKFISQHGYLDREKARIEEEGDLATLRGRVREAEAAVAAVRSQRAALVAEVRRSNLDHVNDGQQKAQALQQELIKAETRGRLMKLASPVDGTVQQLAVHTVGGVVTPAQQLMVIVPRDQPVEVEAFMENKDVGFVAVGQEAEVKVQTFQYTKYGTLPAKVAMVSNDAISDEKLGLVYALRARLERATLDVEGKTVPLSPGMAVTVEIKTGRRRVMEYFLSPLIQHGRESLRER